MHRVVDPDVLGHRPFAVGRGEGDRRDEVVRGEPVGQVGHLEGVERRGVPVVPVGVPEGPSGEGVVPDRGVGEARPLLEVDLTGEGERRPQGHADQQDIEAGVEDQRAELAPMTPFDRQLGGVLLRGDDPGPVGTEGTPSTVEDVGLRHARRQGQLGPMGQPVEVATPDWWLAHVAGERRPARHEAAGQADEQQDRQHAEPPRAEHVVQRQGIEDARDGSPRSLLPRPPQPDGRGDDGFLRDEGGDQRRDGQREQQDQRRRHPSEASPETPGDLPRGGQEGESRAGRAGGGRLLVVGGPRRHGIGHQRVAVQYDPFPRWRRTDRRTVRACCSSPWRITGSDAASTGCPQVWTTLYVGPTSAWGWVRWGVRSR